MEPGVIVGAVGNPTGAVSWQLLYTIKRSTMSFVNIVW